MATKSMSYREILLSKLPHPIHNDEEANRVREEIQSLVRTHPRRRRRRVSLAPRAVAYCLGEWTLHGADYLRC